MSASSDPPVLSASGIDKRYGGVEALNDAHLDLFGDEIHGLCGENGSGKSTLLKILSGQVQRDAGRVVLDGREVHFGDASDALAVGITSVTQETSLVPELSVAENIFLGRQKPRSWWGVDWSETRRRASGILERLDCDVDPEVPVGNLRPDLQQMVEIARALSIEARVLILDEPTSSLSDDEVASLFEVVRTLRGSGIAVVFVSHRLNEVLDLADRLTILRDGRVVGGGSISEFDESELIRLMIGRVLDELSLESRQERREEPALRVRRLTVPGRVDEVSFDVGAGEAVGLAGLIGAGRSHVLEALFGLEPDSSGSVEIDGQAVAPEGPREAIRAGFGLVPADRNQFGLVLKMSVRENVVMARTALLPRLRLPRRAWEQSAVEDAVDDFRIVLDDPSDPVAALSGGNQQKVVLAKWFETAPRVLLLDEPTQGVDVGAKAAIYQLLDQAREQGTSLVISSSEPSELRLLCNRILVMYRGRVVAELAREQATEARVAHYAMGHGV